MLETAIRTAMRRVGASDTLMSRRGPSRPSLLLTAGSERRAGSFDAACDAWADIQWRCASLPAKQLETTQTCTGGKADAPNEEQSGLSQLTDRKRPTPSRAAPSPPAPCRRLRAGAPPPTWIAASSVRSPSMAFVLHLGLAAAAADLERTALIDLARATNLSGWAPPHR